MVPIATGSANDRDWAASQLTQAEPSRAREKGTKWFGEYPTLPHASGLTGLGLLFQQKLCQVGIVNTTEQPHDKAIISFLNNDMPLVYLVGILVFRSAHRSEVFVDKMQRQEESGFGRATAQADE